MSTYKVDSPTKLIDQINNKLTPIRGKGAKLGVGKT